MAQRFKSPKALHLDPRRMHIEISLSRSSSHLLMPHEGEAHRVLDHPLSHEAIRQLAQATFGRPTPRQRQLNGASVRAVAQGTQNCRLVLLAREAPNRQQSHDRPPAPFIPTFIDHTIQRDAVR